VLVLVGSNHRSAPVAVRERMSFPLGSLPEAHAQLARLPAVAEGLILSTCNRVEILARARADTTETVAALEDFLARQHGLRSEEIRSYTYRLSGDDAIRHLFGVASGLDSMILGEPQILGQVKQAYRAGKELGTVGPVLDRLLQHCLATAKRVRSETGISRHAVSVAFAAVELSRKIFGDLAGRRALLVGAGKMGDLVGRHLVASGVTSLFVTSRTQTKAVVHAELLGAKPVHWDERLGRLREVDIVVSCTGAPHVVLTKADVARALRGRRLGPLFVIDIAVPRDVEPAVNELDNVYLYDIDALQGVIEENLEERRVAAERAKRLVAEEAAAFRRWIETQQVTPMIVSLRRSLLSVGTHEIERLRGRLGELDEKQRGAVEELARGIIQKILHRPIRRLRDSVDRGDTLECSALYREIFDLEAEDGAAADAGEGPRRVLDGGKTGG
jgi:glutamyl-tRNA reductase